MKLDLLRDEIENLNTDARLELTRDLLLRAAEDEREKMVPLGMSIWEERREDEEDKAGLIASLAVLAGSLGLLAFALCKGKKKLEEKAREEEAKIEEEKRELYRRLSSIKGRI